jgi:hypothetical protein
MQQGSVSAWEVGFVLERLGNILNSDETELTVRAVGMSVGNNC